eukprot:5992992-Amphidinium_carterae.1
MEGRCPLNPFSNYSLSNADRMRNISSEKSRRVSLDDSGERCPMHRPTKPAAPPREEKGVS